MGANHDIIDRSTAVEAVLDLRSETLEDLVAETVSITDAFEGRALAAPIVSETHVPERSHATMDGYAIDATDEFPLELVDGEVYPESDPPSLAESQAVRVATGAPIPPETNAVLKVEDAAVSDGRLEGPAIEPGTYVYERGSNVAAGEQLFAAGERLSPKDAVLLRDVGREAVSVREPYEVGLLATGTEIHEGRSRDLDSPMLASLVRSWGHEATYEGTVPDQYDRVAEAIAAVADEHDVVVTTGGTSVGEKDHVIAALDELGEIAFHRVRVRPGKPLAAARLPDHDAVAFAVPGKPVGAHAVVTLVVRAFFTGDGALPTIPATATRGVDVPTAGFDYAIPVTLSGDEATPLGAPDSAFSVYGDTFDPSVLSSSTRATRADGFVYAETGFEAKERVRVVPYGAVE